MSDSLVQYHVYPSILRDCLLRDARHDRRVDHAPPLFADIFTVQQLSREIRLWTRFVPQRRFKQILQRVFDGSLERFVRIMHDTGSIITGSCTLNMLLGDSYDSSSSDLNLIVPHEHFSERITYLKEEGGYIDVEKKESPHPSVASACSRFGRYHKRHLSVTLSQASVTVPLRTIVCGNTSADMTFMTGGGVVTSYPDFTLHGKNIRAEMTGYACTGESQIGSLKANNLVLESDSSFLGLPCRRSCPSVWQSFTEYVHCEDGVYNWDTDFNVRRVFKGCGVEWKLREGCVNSQCERDVNKLDQAILSY
ncbi:hypothetical protein K503DRAFT_250338 [Rhizopogon vinicolor AM-OR11-026]|uniref:Uncharacterized protein n=1 Tax=Rhizopogon vinicolor AM-OR11-026 TaxID=1314800 RepID=A0A1B7MX87_9AGAM|nr:hypothetical protein K503DRAFT_250338 [Rhizopogon vinicolor AM-OR11-026]